MNQDLLWHNLLYSGFRYDFENTYSPNVEWLLSLAKLEKITVNLMFFPLIFLRTTTNEQVLVLKLPWQPHFFNLSSCFFPAYIPANKEQVLLLQLVRHLAFLTSVFLAFLSSLIYSCEQQATSKYFSYNLSNKLAFHTLSLFKRNCLSIFIHEWQGWSQIPNSSWSFEAWNDCRRIEGVHRFTGRAK